MQHSIGFNGKYIKACAIVHCIQCPAQIIFGKTHKADIAFIEVKDLKGRLGHWRGLACCGQGRVGLGSSSPLASRLEALPVVSSNPPPPPLTVFL